MGMLVPSRWRMADGWPMDDLHVACWPSFPGMDSVHDRIGIGRSKSTLGRSRMQ
eukprot:COSAG01_NODE_34514_length_546_cov_1.214765_1_plen_53_part_10